METASGEMSMLAIHTLYPNGLRATGAGFLFSLLFSLLELFLC